ncbi:MAG: hypothetical protein Q7U98_04085 [Methylicorpusculum sp.]|nr:hypothetical protein [Methylicorpusculum sp.]MDO8938316.1 hypothetical protein [Methylicorpusculum sp.]
MANPLNKTLFALGVERLAEASSQGLPGSRTQEQQQQQQQQQSSPTG